jgi:hypothetical protein
MAKTTVGSSFKETLLCIFEIGEYYIFHVTKRHLVSLAEYMVNDSRAQRGIMTFSLKPSIGTSMGKMS